MSLGLLVVVDVPVGRDAPRAVDIRRNVPVEPPMIQQGTSSASSSAQGIPCFTQFAHLLTPREVDPRAGRSGREDLRDLAVDARHMRGYVGDGRPRSRAHGLRAVATLVARG